MTDSAANRDSTQHPRDFEAQMLVELLRLSRVTVLYGAQGVGKTTLLKTGVLPLLRSRAEERNFAQGEEPSVLVPFTGRYDGDGTVERGGEIAIVFDRWSDTPLTDLQEQILDMLPIGSPPMATVMPTLTDILAAWNEEIGVRFFVILDSFEQYLRAPFDRAGIAEFDYEFVRMVNEPLLAAHFLLSVRDDAEALLNRYRRRISGFGDAFLRLPDLHHVTAPSTAPGAQTYRPAAAATTPVAAFETLTKQQSEPPRPPFILTAALTAGPLPARAAFLAGSGEAVRSSTVSEGTLSDVQPLEVTACASDKPDAEPAIEAGFFSLAQPYSDEKRAQFTLVPEAHGAAPGEAGPAPSTRPEAQRRVRSPVRILLAAIVAGVAVGAGAGYFAMYDNQKTETAQSAASAKGVAPATEHTPGLATVLVPPAPATVPVAPAPRAEDLVPPPSSEQASGAHSAGPPPGSPTPIKKTKAAPRTSKRTASAAAPIAPPAVSEAAPEVVAAPVVVAAPAVIGWQTAMRRELEACRENSFFERVLCTEKVRWRHCAPDRWNTTPECGAGNTQ